MPRLYYCSICNSKPRQKSHHDAHIKSAKHKAQVQIFRLKLEKLSEQELINKYNSSDINNIIKKMETVVVNNNNNKNKNNNNNNKVISNEIIWSLENNQDSNENYNNIKSKLDSIIKQCHDLLRGKGGSIVGNKAQNDIMRILCLKILQCQFNDENSELWKRCNKVKSDGNMSDTQFNRFKTYCNDITEITKKDDVFKEWRIFVNKFLIKVFPSIYYENDNKFHCHKSLCIIELIKIIDSLNIDDEFKDAFSTTCGDIHESFRAYGGKNSGAKALGQFFTPRQLIHLMFHGIGLDKLIEPIEDITIYDPCMGTGGFLTRLFKMCNIPSENIFGCETEIDTIKFGEMSMVLTTGNSRNNIIKCDSLCENQFIFNKKFKAIVTNPPFSTKQDYKLLKENFNKTYPDSLVKFEEIYPHNIGGKPGGTCLFIQHCVYMLEEGGFCAIVLPYGEIFEGIRKKIKQFREWFLQKVNIRTILKVPNGVFEHASVSTNVVVFTKDGPTQNIRFMETTKECNVIKDMFTISSEELKCTGYSLDVGEYLVDETDNYDVPMVALGEVCEFNSGKFNSNEMDNDGEIPFYTSSAKNPVGTHSKCSFDHNEYILITTAGGSESNLDGNHGMGKVYLVNGKTACRSTVKAITIKTSSISYLYLYNILKFNRLNINKLANFTTNLGVIPREKLIKYKIPLPSLEVQQQIVDELSQIETSIETIESRITQLKSEKDQYQKYGRKVEIRELLKDSEEKMLCEVCELNKNSIRSEDDYNEIKYIALSNVNEGYVKNIKTINFKDKPSRASRKCNIGDVLLGGTRPNLRNHCIITEDLHSDNLIVSTAFIVLTPIEVLSKYIYNLIMSDDITNLLVSKCTSDPPAINITNASSIKIPIPSQEVQQQCIKLFEEKEKFIQSIDEKINSEKEYITHLKKMAKDVISSFC